MRFIDLFAGLGGFHLALRRLGHECVFASEIDSDLSQVYEKNFGLKPGGDIRQIPVTDIPGHDILCAGFPCQPFSKAGEQKGREDPRGILFSNVLHILKEHKPLYIFLENVPQLELHNKRQTWMRMEAELRELGYDVRSRLLSPHQFGIPQIRQRLFIVGIRTSGGLQDFQWPEPIPSAHPNLMDILDNNPADAKSLTAQVVQCIEAWGKFLHLFPKDKKLPSFPIWSMEFGATYPYDETTPFALGVDGLRAFRGSHGAALSHLPDDQIFAMLPSYARASQTMFPMWKVTFIRQNRELYVNNQAWIDKWLSCILEFPPSLQKFEWNCQGEERDIWKYVLQFRASGLRVKRSSTAPSLIAMTTTQVPIIAWERRYMTVRECARLQSMEDLKHLPASATKAYGALGNAVNVDIVSWIAEALLNIRPQQPEISASYVAAIASA